MPLYVSPQTAETAATAQIHVYTYEIPYGSVCDPGEAHVWRNPSGVVGPDQHASDLTDTAIRPVHRRQTTDTRRYDVTNGPIGSYTYHPPSCPSYWRRKFGLLVTNPEPRRHTLNSTLRTLPPSASSRHKDALKTFYSCVLTVLSRGVDEYRCCRVLLTTSETTSETMAPTEYAKLKVAELKELLKERGLAVTGKKAELVARLEEADDVDGGEEEVLPVVEDAPASEVKPMKEDVADKQPADLDANVKPMKEDVADKQPADLELSSYVWGPIPVAAGLDANELPGDARGRPEKKRKRKSRWETASEATDQDHRGGKDASSSRALVLFPGEVVLSNGLKINLPVALTGRWVLDSTDVPTPFPLPPSDSLTRATRFARSPGTHLGGLKWSSCIWTWPRWSDRFAWGSMSIRGRSTSARRVRRPFMMHTVCV